MHQGISISPPPEMENVEVRTHVGLLFIISTTGESLKKRKKKKKVSLVCH